MDSINQTIATAITTEASKVEGVVDSSVSTALAAAQTAVSALPPSPLSAAAEVIVTLTREEQGVITSLFNTLIELGVTKLIPVAGKILNAVEKEASSFLGNIEGKIESEFKKIESKL